MKLSYITSILIILSSSLGLTIEQPPGMPGSFSQIDQGIYIGGTPDGMQGLNFLKQVGIRTIFNLQGADFILKILPGERKGEIQDEINNARKIGIVDFSYPISAILYPSVSDEALLRRLLIGMNDESLRPIYIHCHLGDDRANLVVALYRYCLNNPNWSVEKIKEEMRRAGHNGIRRIFTVNLDRFFEHVTETPGWCPTVVD